MDVDKSLKIPFKTTNPFDSSRSIYFFCDVPHLLKTTRNCFSKSFAHSNSRFLKVSEVQNIATANMLVIKFSHMIFYYTCSILFNARIF